MPFEKTVLIVTPAVRIAMLTWRQIPKYTWMSVIDKACSCLAQSHLCRALQFPISGAIKITGRSPFPRKTEQRSVQAAQIKDGANQDGEGHREMRPRVPQSY